MRLIDAESDYIKELINRIGFKSREDIQSFIDNAPTADARPNIYAEWIEYDRDVMGRSYYKCSRCGSEHHSKKANFCEDCGAKMEGKDGEQK